MKTRKFFFAFVLVVFGSFVLASCNNDSAAEDENLYDNPIEIGVDNDDITEYEQD